ncbi:hypothetical protein BLA29_015479 [Euroglyphus maynei]|uniref:Uncharacterized protein n=1 Tax=Euroglyphus maynei TaxID=6958 RepID=A0A1Y3BS34_EURMA|nr:hypothetical protein BLA29_015479 [Euroglyphus maynei]
MQTHENDTKNTLSSLVAFGVPTVMDAHSAHAFCSISMRACNPRYL